MKKVLGFIDKAEMWIAAFFLIIATFMTFIAAITRAFNYPINWAIDISLFLWAWCIFFGADFAIRNNKLVGFDLVPNKLPPRIRKVYSTILYLIILVFLVALLIYGSIVTYTTRVRPFQSIPQISYSWVALSLPVSALLMIRSVIGRIIGFYKKEPVEEKKETEEEHVGEPL